MITVHLWVSKWASSKPSPIYKSFNSIFYLISNFAAAFDLNVWLLLILKYIEQQLQHIIITTNYNLFECNLLQHLLDMVKIVIYAKTSQCLLVVDNGSSHVGFPEGVGKTPQGFPSDSGSQRPQQHEGRKPNGIQVCNLITK